MIYSASRTIQQQESTTRMSPTGPKLNNFNQQPMLLSFKVKLDNLINFNTHTVMLIQQKGKEKKKDVVALEGHLCQLN